MRRQVSGELDRTGVGVARVVAGTAGGGLVAPGGHAGPNSTTAAGPPRGPAALAGRLGTPVVCRGCPGANLACHPRASKGGRQATFARAWLDGSGDETRTPVGSKWG
jgi:hypothetical protein